MLFNTTLSGLAAAVCALLPGHATVKSHETDYFYTFSLNFRRGKKHKKLYKKKKQKRKKT